MVNDRLYGRVCSTVNVMLTPPQVRREWPQIPHPAASPTQREWPQIWRGGAAGEAADLHHRQGGGSRCRAWAAPQHFEELLVVARPERRRDDRLGNRN